MKREIELRRRLQSLTTLREAVGAMKTLSAHHFREARAAVEPARIYREGVQRIVEWVGGALAAGDGPVGLLIIGGELGLCGGYNARVVAAAVEARRELGDGPTLCVGRRAAALLARRGVALDRRYGAPTSVHGILELLLDLAGDVLTTHLSGRLSSFHVVSSRFAGVGLARPERVRLLPIASGRAAPAKPARYVARDRLALAAAREFLYITMVDLLLDALASEHSARLVATQSAERWLDEHTEGLRRHLASVRREASTQETIEIAAGARRTRDGQDPFGEAPTGRARR
jgi:F-type H+-transporting ATPase subunit gamma